MAEGEAPFKVEYAKSGRAGCKLCKGIITKDTLRLAKMVQVEPCVQATLHAVCFTPVLSV